jgi:hypothetical protein
MVIVTIPDRGRSPVNNWRAIGGSGARGHYSLFPRHLHALCYFVPITIQLPDLKSQTNFNVARWSELVADPELARLPNRIETDRHGRLINGRGVVLHQLAQRIRI